jgi:uncharacterized membrane protein YkvI
MEQAIHKVQISLGKLVHGVETRPLRKPFQIYTVLFVQRMALVTAHLDFSNNSNQWNINFVRTTHGWEVNAFASFFILLYSVRVNEMVNKLRWSPSRKGCLLLAPSTMSLLVMMSLLSLGKAFGRLKFL